MVSAVILGTLFLVRFINYSNLWYHNKIFTSFSHFILIKSQRLLEHLGAAWSILELINNVSRFIFLYHFFSMDVDPIDASILSSLVASGLSYLSINVVLAIQYLSNRNRFCKLFIQGSFRGSLKVTEPVGNRSNRSGHKNRVMGINAFTFRADIYTL